MRLHGQVDGMRLNQATVDLLSEQIPHPSVEDILDRDWSESTIEELKDVSDAIYVANPKRITQYRLAMRTRSPMAKHVRVLKWMQKTHIRRIQRAANPLRVPRLRTEFLLSLPGFVAVAAAGILLRAFTYILNAEFEVAIATVIQSPWFEMPPADPAMPMIEPTSELAMGIALAPVIGLFLSLESLSLSLSSEKKHLPRVFSIIFLTLSVVAILLFSFLMNKPADNLIDSAFTQPVMPWYASALFMAVMAFCNAFIAFCFFSICKSMVELSESDQRWDSRPVSEYNRVTQAIADTMPSLGIIEGAIERFESGRNLFRDQVYSIAEQKKRHRRIMDLKREIDDLSF